MKQDQFRNHSGTHPKNAVLPLTGVLSLALLALAWLITRNTR